MTPNSLQTKMREKSEICLSENDLLSLTNNFAFDKTVGTTFFDQTLAWVITARLIKRVRAEFDMAVSK